MASEVSAMTLQELFGVELPIIQAPMAGSGCRAIPAAAVTRSLMN
jgi:NAD(P)H-dependent flavin oxidoreductase YrpB (nitropropane dioxygenase family)